MATEAAVRSRIDTILRVVAAEVGDLPYRAEWWETESEENQISFYLEWKELMDRLESVYRAHCRGELRPDQEARYHAVLRALQEALPTITRLKLYPPSVPLDS